MKRIYTVLCGLIVVVLFCVGCYGLFHLDSTVKKPKLTFSALLNGKFATACVNRYSEAFPKSESLQNTAKKLNSFYKFSALSGGDGVQIIIDMNSNAAHGGEALKPTEPQSVSSSAPSGADVTDEPTEPPTEPEEEDDPDAVVEDLGQAILIDDRAIEIPYANYDKIETYAQAVTNIATALGSGVRTFSIAVPNSAEFYTPKDYHTGDKSQKGMIDFCYEKMGDNVITVDAYSKLKPHKDEYIYFRTDHHWTQLGAYYAYTAYCEAAGLKAEPLSKFETGSYSDFLGSMYHNLSSFPQASVQANNPDTVEFYRPFVDLNTNFYTDATLSEKYATGTICYIEPNVSNKYLCFLGGDHPITIIETSAKGPVCMLLKESYGNAFAPWLTSHYSKVIVVDPREFNRDGKPSLDLVSFAKQQNVKDCIVLNYPMMLNSEAYIEWLNRLVQ